MLFTSAIDYVTLDDGQFLRVWGRYERRRAGETLLGLQSMLISELLADSMFSSF